MREWTHRLPDSLSPSSHLSLVSAPKTCEAFPQHSLSKSRKKRIFRNVITYILMCTICTTRKYDFSHPRHNDFYCTNGILSPNIIYIGKLSADKKKKKCPHKVKNYWYFYNFGPHNIGNIRH